jgi:RecA/RadA recombinase
MAKKAGKSNSAAPTSGGFSKIKGIFDAIEKKVPIRFETEAKEKTYISTGCYIVDAAFSGKLLNGGIASNRITILAGESGVGKSFLSYSIAKMAQRAGYIVWYIDTEQAIELIDLPKYKIDIDPEKFQLMRTNIVEDLTVTLTQFLDGLIKMKESGDTPPKILIVMDSLAHLASRKEKEDLIAGNNKQDMTRAKAIAQMFRVIAGDLGYLEIPMVVTNHTYKTMDLFPQEVLKGGNGAKYSASIVAFMSKAKLKDGTEEDDDLGASGFKMTLKTSKNRMAKSKKVTVDISYNSGTNRYSSLDLFCTPENFEEVGIAKGKKYIDEDGVVCLKPGGNFWYIRHLDKSLPTKQIYNSKVFNKEVMEALDKIISKHFQYSDMIEYDEAEDVLDIMNTEIIDTDGIDSDDFFTED